MTNLQQELRLDYRLFRRRVRMALAIGARVIENSVHDRVFALSAQLAFYCLLALFPFLLLLTTLLPFFSTQTLDSLASILMPLIPPSIVDMVMDNLHQALGHKRHGLLSFSAVILLWSSSSAFLSLMQGLNVAYNVEETRSIWRTRVNAMALTLLLGMMVVISTFMLTFGRLLNTLAASYMPISVTFWVLLRWVFAILFLMLTLDIIYYTAPNVRHPWRWFSPGALIATPVWVVMSIAYSVYLSRFGRYDLTYGALAAIITLMFWFYFSGVVVLFGGELNSVLERRIYQDVRRRGRPLFGRRYPRRRRRSAQP